MYAVANFQFSTMLMSQPFIAVNSKSYQLDKFKLAAHLKEMAYILLIGARDGLLIFNAFKTKLLSINRPRKPVLP